MSYTGAKREGYTANSFVVVHGCTNSIHHRVTLSFTEFHQFEIKRIELRETLCYSVVKTHYYTIMHPLILLLSAAPDTPFRLLLL